MSGYGYSRQAVMLDGTSANSNVTISPPFLVADAGQISISYITVVASVNSLTVQGSNDDGLSQGASSLSTTVSLPFWSTISTVASQGIFTVTPGARWIRVMRVATDSRASVLLNYRVW